MHMKRLIITYLIIFALLTACTTERISTISESPGSTTSIDSISATVNVSPDLSNDNQEKYKKDLVENLTVDAEIKAPNISIAPILKAKNSVFDEEKLCEVFFSNNDIDFKSEESSMTFTKEDKTLLLSIDKSFFQFNTSLSDYFGGIINPEDFGNLSKFKKERLDFMDKQQAIDLASNILKSIGINPYGQPEIYSIDFETIQEEQQLRLKEGGLQYFVDVGVAKLKDKWTKDDEFYYIIYKIEVNGLPCDSIGYTQMPSGLPVSGSRIDIAISKSGLAMMKIKDTVYQSEGNESKPSVLISVDKALETIEKRFENIILPNKMVITDISLAYSPSLISFEPDTKTGGIKNRKILLIPAWIFKIQQKIDNLRGGTGEADMELISNTYIRINAITGNEIK